MGSVSLGSDASTDDFKDLKSTFVFFTNDFPTDDTGELFRSLQRHSKDLRWKQLATFLQLCNREIKNEVALLPKSWQDHMPPVDDVLALVNDVSFRKGPLGGAMEGVYLCIFQIGALIM